MIHTRTTPSKTKSSSSCDFFINLQIFNYSAFYLKIEMDTFGNVNPDYKKFFSHLVLINTFFGMHQATLDNINKIREAPSSIIFITTSNVNRLGEIAIIWLGWRFECIPTYIEGLRDSRRNSCDGRNCAIRLVVPF